MKKSLILLILLAMAAFARNDCRINATSKIDIRDTTIWHTHYTFLYGCYTIADDTLSETLPDGYRCNKIKKEEKAFLDTNVFLQKERVAGANIIYIFGLNIADHEIGDVFRDEFLHWQQCGMLNLTYEEADSFVTPLVKPLNDNWSDAPYYYESDLFFAADYGTGGPYPQQFVKWAKEACATTSVEHPQRTPAINIVYENGRAQIPEHLRGERYFIFDMNGRILQKGLAAETIDLPPTPSILKIGNETSALVK
ncbi:MAG: hypothetical protein MJY98_11655 [Fibrobacter sp.]|nr:hypothetical protein [Fibrobacter sp.]